MKQAIKTSEKSMNRVEKNIPNNISEKINRIYRDYIETHKREHDKFFWSFGKSKLKLPWYTTTKPLNEDN